MLVIPVAAIARGVCMLLLIIAATPGGAAAQKDYFNTDRGRPLHVQDATPIERYAFELQAAPVRWSRSTGGRSVLSIEPEIAYGIFARTQLEIGLPVFITEGFGGGTRSGVGALHVSALHALNVETLGLPGMALSVGVTVPGGNFGPRQATTTLGAIGTRTLSFGRLHVNADLTLGDAIDEDDSRWVGPTSAGLEELSRWSAGVAVDRALPLRSMLLGAELVARQPVHDGADLSWHVATGVRWQLDPYWALDAGIGRTLGDEREWSLTLGAARAFSLVNLIPLSR